MGAVVALHRSAFVGASLAVSRFKPRIVRDQEPQVIAPNDAARDALRRAGRGDQQAFGAFYDEVASLVYGVVLKVIRNPAISEEVTQDVFVELWRIAARFDPEKGNVRSWVTTIAHRRAVDRVRSEESSRAREERVTREAPHHDDSVEEEVSAALEAKRVTDALARLTDLQRQAIELAYYGGNTYQETAVLLGVPEGTVKTRIRDGMVRLRDSLGVTP